MADESGAGGGGETVEISELTELLPLVYEDLKDLARRYLAAENPNHTLQTTALVNEAYLRMCSSRNLKATSRNKFFAAASRIMRRVLIDHARTKKRQKRGGGMERVTLSGVDVAGPDDTLDLLALDAALEKLATLSSRAAQVVEMRYFGGMKVAEVADVLGVATRTVDGDWDFARAWLRRELSGERKG
jgi:RNA polymerase sigma factor (TIGR02999 family)